MHSFSSNQLLSFVDLGDDRFVAERQDSIAQFALFRIETLPFQVKILMKQAMSSETSCRER